MRHIALSLTSAIEDVSFVGEKVGHPVDEKGGEFTIGEVVPNTKLGAEEVGLMVLMSDCFGAVDKEGVVIGDDFVMHSSLLT